MSNKPIIPAAFLLDSPDVLQVGLAADETIGLMPGGGGSLDLAFSSVLDSRVTFTRASSAMYYDATGTLKTVTTNNPRFDFGASPGGVTNWIRNSKMVGAVAGSPGTPPTFWGVAANNALVWSVVGTGTEGGISYIDYRLSGTSSSGGISYLQVETTTPSGFVGQSWTSAANFRLVGGSFANLTAATLGVEEHAAVGGGFIAATETSIIGVTNAALATQRLSVTRVLTTISVNNVVVKLSYNIGAVIDVTIRIGAPQLESGAVASAYVPTTSAAANFGASPLGLLIEEARTNLVFPSNPDNSAWSFGGGASGTITASAAVAPDGTTTGAKLTDGAALSQFRINPVANSWTAGTVYSAFAYAKAGTKSIFQMSFNSAPFNGVPCVNFNLAAGTITFTAGSSYLSSTITALGNGWYRCTVTMTADISATGSIILGIVNGATDTRFTAYTGDGTGTMYFWGAQVEAGAFPSSLIASTGSAATRAVDTAVLTPLGSSYVADKGSMAADFILPFATPGGKSWGVVAICDRTANNQIRFRVPANSSTVLRADIVTATVSQVVMDATFVVGVTLNKAAMSWSATGGATLYGNAIAGGNGAGAISIPAVTSIVLGGWGDGSNTLSGWFKRFRYWPRVLSVTELQSATR